MFIRRRAQVERPQLPPTAHSARRHHRPVSSQLAGFWGPGMFEEKGLVGEAEAGVPDGPGLRSLDRSGLQSVAVHPSAEAAVSHGDWLVICSPVPAQGET